MLWRTYLLNRLVGTRDISFIVGRHPVVYAKVLIQYTAVFFLLFLIYRVAILWVAFDLLQLIFGIVIGLTYCIAIFMLLRSYFDIMVATQDYLYIVFWDSFYKYRIKMITRSSIQDISVSPSSKRLSVVLKDANISIATEQDEVIEFTHVRNATHVAKNMYLLREHHLHPDIPEPSIKHEENIDDEKFKVLVETLGEVIVDYMNKKQE